MDLVEAFESIQHIKLGRSSLIPPIESSLGEPIWASDVIVRFYDPSYPESIFYRTGYDYGEVEFFPLDTVLTHTVRAAELAMRIFRNCRNEIDLPKLIKTILVHDLPELMVSDTPALSGQSMPELHVENEAAKGLLDPNDYNLFLEFQSSRQYLEGKDIQYTPEGLIANCLDLLDGNNIFMFALLETNLAWKQNGIDCAQLMIQGWEYYKATSQMYSQRILHTTNPALKRALELFDEYEQIIKGKVEELHKRSLEDYIAHQGMFGDVRRRLANSEILRDHIIGT
ncbi:MAG TPA: HD domain-containing protein [bacterium]|nr:HD domain-containing protein [bacterium]